jgi:hypothetical protein
VTDSPRATRYTYYGLFLVSMATLMYEILLTRIFSVTMWYHFAFVAISMAMFGMTVGSVIVYLAPRWFSPSLVKIRLAGWALAFPIAMVLSFLTQLSVPFILHASVVGLYSIAFTYAVISVPFAVAGVCVSVVLTRFPARISQLYASDLAGAALGCVLLIAVMTMTDGPTAVILVAGVAGLGAVFFAVDAAAVRLRRAAVVVTVVLGVAAAGHTVLVQRQFPVLRILYAKGSFEPRALYERWNSYSRVRVWGNPDEPQRPFARTLSPTFPADRMVRELRMDIDVSASTSVTAYSGDPAQIEHLTYDVTAFGHHVRPARDVLVVGTGGGRDILAALAMGAQSVTGVEINADIIRMITGRFGDYTGHLDRDPRVHFVNEEARSYIARTSAKHDLIEISLIDTWAATAAGAFALSENALYTVEAWRIFLEHLTDRGMLSVSRWYLEGQPAEVYRTVTLASESLRAIGIIEPRRHIAVIRTRPLSHGSQFVGVGTMLVSRTPFTEADVSRLQEQAGRLQFDVLLTPTAASDPVLEQITSAQAAETIRSFPLNIAAPTDDSPFFFHMLRLRDIGKVGLLTAGKSTPNMMAVFVLGALLLNVFVLTSLCIVVPLWIGTDRSALHGNGGLLLFFAAIGLGFMLVETSQMQRLIIVLGHPTYALSVLLTTLLLSSGLGSSMTSGIDGDSVRRSGLVRLGMIVVVLFVFGALTPWIARTFEGATTPVRIVSAVVLLFPAGMAMGMAFPIGMKLANRRAPGLTPWLWGINGALSVLASVLAIVIALAVSISAAFWTGWFVYVIALAAFARCSGAGSGPGRAGTAARA